MPNNFDAIESDPTLYLIGAAVAIAYLVAMMGAGMIALYGGAIVYETIQRIRGKS